MDVVLKNKENKILFLFEDVLLKVIVLIFLT